MSENRRKHSSPHLLQPTGLGINTGETTDAGRVKSGLVSVVIACPLLEGEDADYTLLLCCCSGGVGEWGRISAGVGRTEFSSFTYIGLIMMMAIDNKLQGYSVAY